MFRSGFHYGIKQPTNALAVWPHVVPASGTFFVSLWQSDPLIGHILDVFRIKRAEVK
jgi:hypothetical protein